METDELRSEAKQRKEKRTQLGSLPSHVSKRMVLWIAYMVLWQWTMCHGFTLVLDGRFPACMPWRWSGSLALCGQRLNLQSTHACTCIGDRYRSPCSSYGRLTWIVVLPVAPAVMGIMWLGVLPHPWTPSAKYLAPSYATGARGWPLLPVWIVGHTWTQAWPLPSLAMLMMIEV